jgi:hypothetical protein
MGLADESWFGLRPCALFRTLITELRGDWLQMRELRALKVELTASACREFEVASAFVPRRASNFRFVLRDFGLTLSGIVGWAELGPAQRGVRQGALVCFTVMGFLRSGDSFDQNR